MITLKNNKLLSIQLIPLMPFNRWWTSLTSKTPKMVSSLEAESYYIVPSQGEDHYHELLARHHSLLYVLLQYASGIFGRTF